MVVIKSSKIIYVDVDDTLVMWNWREFTDDMNDLMYIHSDIGESIPVFPHYRHVEKIKQFKVRGHSVVVWSQGGHEWAEKVVKALGIEAYVDLVIAKPDWYIDDLPSSAFMKAPIFLHPVDPEQDQSSWEVKDKK